MAKMNAKTIDARSVELAKTVKGLAGEIHSHLMTIARHVTGDGNGDVSVAVNFMNALRQNDRTGNSVSAIRLNAVKTWLSHFAFVKFSGGEGTEKFSAKLAGKAWEAAKAEGIANHFKAASSSPWNKYQTEKHESVFDLDKAFALSIKRMIETAREKAGKSVTLKDGTVKANDVSEATLARLEALAAEYPV